MSETNSGGTSNAARSLAPQPWTYAEPLISKRKPLESLSQYRPHPELIRRGTEKRDYKEGQMAYFAIKYQLNEAKDYPTLWDELGRLSAHKVTKSFYFLDLAETTTDSICQHFKQFIDSDDMICVVRIESKPSAVRCYQGSNAWIEARLD